VKTTTPETGLTVLIPTYNRADMLRQTLNSLAEVDRSGIDCEIVVIDNNSTDKTADVVKDFRGKLPVVLLTETRQGKNCALNKALRECTLRDIVVFADDDVSPAKDWFQEIVRSAERWPAVAVFGGKIDVLWPDKHEPQWAMANWIKAFGFSWHHYADGEALYKPPAAPFGPNFWVRKLVFETVPFFDETIGPNSKNRIMGSETSFLMELQRHAFKMLYYPYARVQHRIIPKDCTVSALRRRAYTFGRGQVRLHGWHRRDLYFQSKLLWFLTCAADYIYTCLRFLHGSLLSDPRRSCEITVSSVVRFGNLRETRNQVLERCGAARRNSAFLSLSKELR
jgi:glycosyltransferase involved in cell wall biosynthesis